MMRGPIRRRKMKAKIKAGRPTTAKEKKPKVGPPEAPMAVIMPPVREMKATGIRKRDGLMRALADAAMTAGMSKEAVATLLMNMEKAPVTPRMRDMACWGLFSATMASLAPIQA